MKAQSIDLEALIARGANITDATTGQPMTLDNLNVSPEPEVVTAEVVSVPTPPPFSTRKIPTPPPFVEPRRSPIIFFEFGRLLIRLGSWFQKG